MAVGQPLTPENTQPLSELFTLYLKSREGAGGYGTEKRASQESFSDTPLRNCKGVNPVQVLKARIKALGSV